MRIRGRNTRLPFPTPVQSQSQLSDSKVIVLLTDYRYATRQWGRDYEIGSLMNHQSLGSDDEVSNH